MSVFFFFSSRRRHTRFKCDWSSDVCSSDLEEFLLWDERINATVGVRRERSSANGDRKAFNAYPKAAVSYRLVDPLPYVNRSEERRVGKEGRSRWSPDH